MVSGGQSSAAPADPGDVSHLLHQGRSENYAKSETAQADRSSHGVQRRSGDR